MLGKMSPCHGPVLIQARLDRREPESKFGIDSKSMSQPNKDPYNLNVYRYGARTIEHTSQHRHALLGKRKRQ